MQLEYVNTYTLGCIISIILLFITTNMIILTYDYNTYTLKRINDYYFNTYSIVCVAYILSFVSDIRGELDIKASTGLSLILFGFAVIWSVMTEFLKSLNHRINTGTGDKE